ncbi:MAG: PQQ-dependent sugar dehydrogenase, partial [Thermocrispum sp.]
MATAALLLAGLFAVPQATTAVAAVPDGFTDELVIGGLDTPTAVVFAPDGRVFVAEKSGLIKTFDSVDDTSATTAADLRSRVHEYWDRGLLGLAVPPDYPDNASLYAVYSHDSKPWGDGCPNPPGGTAEGCVIDGELVRLAIDPDTGEADGGPQVLLDGWCQQFPSHSVGTVTFGPDGALYVGGGDGASFNYADYGQRSNLCGDPPSATGVDLAPPAARGGALRSQSVRRPAGEPVTLNGTIVRIDPDTGAAMPGNPYAASTDANKRRVIASGMRNQFRFAFRPGTPELWVGDVGWNKWEEINRIPDATDATAENFGWPCYEGSGRQPGYDSENLDVCESLYLHGSQKPPYYAYDHAAKVVQEETCPTGGSSISGIAFEQGSDYPAAYDGALFFADSSRGCVWAMQRGANGQPDPGKIVTFVSGVNIPVQVLTGPGGDLYYLALGAGQLRRVSFARDNHPPTAVAEADPTSGPAPLTVDFDGAQSSDPDAGDTLSYAWDLDGDGQYDDSTAVSPQRTYLDAGQVPVKLRVTDSEGASDTDTVEVTVGDPP